MKNICKWYEKSTKNSKLDREKTNKQTKNNNNDKKKNTPSYSQRQGQHYDIYKKICLTLKTEKNEEGAPNL